MEPPGGERHRWGNREVEMGGSTSVNAGNERVSTQEKFVATLLCSVTAAQLDEVKAFYCRKICMF